MPGVCMLLQKSRGQHNMLSAQVTELQSQHASTLSRKEVLSVRLKEAQASSLHRTGTRSSPGSQALYSPGSLPSPVLSHLSTSGSRMMSREAIFQLAPSTASVRLVPSSRA